MSDLLLDDQTNVLDQNNLTLVSINQLLDADFFIPSYQRGYRWTDVQVEQLLTDIWEFRQKRPKLLTEEEKPFYCLQPVAVKKKECDGKQFWEVIDGQQRLTTILIILYYFNETEFKEPKRLFSLNYQTRTDSDIFLKNIRDAKLAETNIDFHHIYLAYKTVTKWFDDRKKGNEAIRGEFYPVLINEAKVIWYKVETAKDDEERSASIDVFTRLNIGKIPLTNAELVKALFLQKDNFENGKVNLKQLQIAAEWDFIEKTLQDNSFWLFIYDPDNPLKYESRIEYIFDLMKGKKKEDELYFTFNKFSEEFKTKRINNRPDIDNLWLAVKKYFLSFEEWYDSKEFYHLIGFLVDCGVSISVLKKEAEQSTKTEFKDYLKSEVRKQVNCDVDLLSYGEATTKKVLLLFNIQTILATANADIRFPFYRYKEEDWDIEHVRSQTTKTIAKSQRFDWLKDILEYLTGIKGYSDKPAWETGLTEAESQEAAVTAMTEGKEKEISLEIIRLLKMEKMEDERFDDVYKQVSVLFKENENPENIDGISNLALLDSATNRSYKNAMFPIKRKRILDNDMNGVFVPICTKNLFLKSYSRKMSDLLFWQADDAADYLFGIKQVLADYITPEN